jgi:formylglycine-generating enzyme required for sulfatase activity
MPDVAETWERSMEMKAGIRAWVCGVVAALSVSVTGAAPITYPMVTVGNAGNNAELLTGHGAVRYEYEIGKYEVTIGQYSTFLNAVAASDPYGLYNANMGTDLRVAGISRTGAAGSYSYVVMDNGGSSENRPIAYVTWFSAARFANWMHNGQPVGQEGAGTTDTGAYTLNGATSDAAFSRNAGAKYSIPTLDEWFKAAYYSPQLNSGSGGYFGYPTQSRYATPGNQIGSLPNQINGRNNDTGALAVTQNTVEDPAQNYLTAVGAFSGSASFYGTFDQGGNLAEYNDLDGSLSLYRGQKGGSWNGSTVMSSDWVGGGDVQTIYSGPGVGFRLVGAIADPVPEIDPAGAGSVLALVSGALGLIERRRWRRGGGG